VSAPCSRQTFQGLAAAHLTTMDGGNAENAGAFFGLVPPLRSSAAVSRSDGRIFLTFSFIAAVFFLTAAEATY
jgi:hypothetical protein